MPTIELSATPYAVDENGFLEDPTIWNDRVAADLARILELCPSGPAQGACTVAGLPKPTGCV